MNIKGNKTGLKTNSKRILDVMMSKPNLNQSEAYKQIHPNASDVTARNNASQLLKKPEAQIYIQEHINKAKTKIVELVNNDKPDIALRASQDILDRTTGKATIKTESTNYTDINITLGKSPTVTDTDAIQGELIE